MENSNISEEKLRAAMEKLACHIKPPAQVVKEEGSAASDAAGASHTAGTDAQAEPWKGPDGRILLTQMTTAGG